MHSENFGNLLQRRWDVRLLIILLMEKLYEINQGRGRTILMVTHDPNAASFCSRILFIQDGVIFHELRRKIPTETREEFYARILQVMAQMGGGSANVL